MSDETPHEKMRRHDALSEEIHDLRKNRHEVHREIQDELTAAVEAASETTGVSVEVAEVNDTGETYTLRPRLDHAALIREVSESLPGGFHVETFHEDGSIDVMWNEDPETENEINESAVLKAIIRGNTGYGDDVLGTITREEVVDEATRLGLDEDDVRERLDRLEKLQQLQSNEEGHIWI